MGSLVPQSKIVISIIVACSIIVLVILSFIQPYSAYDANTKVQIFLTVILVMFATLEGYSTYIQVVQTEIQNKIKDSWKALELAYGPLFSLLNGSLVGKEILGFFDVEENHKVKLDDIFSRYPFMFPQAIFEFWKEKIQGMEKQYSKDSTHRTIYPVHVEFRKMINDEYQQRVDEYNKLIGKK